MMKPHPFLAAFFLMLPAYADAQRTQTLYYPNGQKRIEGACTFTLNPYFNPSLVGTLLLGESYSRRRYEESAPDIPDADAYYPASRGDRENRLALANLSMICDGPVTMYYADGSKQANMKFKGGVPSGTSTMYYPDGGMLMRGALEAGVPAGKWTRYYKSGAVYSTGRYLPTPQADLRDTWEAAISNRDLDEERRTAKDYTDEGVRSEWSEEGRAAALQLLAFRRFTAGLMQGSRKDGPFTFFRADGEKWAEIHFATDVRTGIWTIWDERGKPTLKLEYNPRGRLIAVTDSVGNRRSLDALTRAWRDDEAARRRNNMPSYGDPNGIDPPMAIVEAPPPPPISSSSGSSGIFTYAEQMPEYPGSINAYFTNNLRYPAQAKKDNIEGRVVVQFVVKEDGSITDARVVRGIGGGCDEEALRLVRAMPKWKPGKQNGKAVAVRYSLPVTFHFR